MSEAQKFIDCVSDKLGESASMPAFIRTVNGYLDKLVSKPLVCRTAQDTGPLKELLGEDVSAAHVVVFHDRSIAFLVADSGRRTIRPTAISMAEISAEAAMRATYLVLRSLGENARAQHVADTFAEYLGKKMAEQYPDSIH